MPELEGVGWPKGEETRTGRRGDGEEEVLELEVEGPGAGEGGEGCGE